MLEPRWRSGGMLPGDSNRDRVTLDHWRSCLIPRVDGLFLNNHLHKGKSHFVFYSIGKFLWISLATLFAYCQHNCSKIVGIPMIALGATHS